MAFIVLLGSLRGFLYTMAYSYIRPSEAQQRIVKASSKVLPTCMVEVAQTALVLAAVRGTSSARMPGETRKDTRPFHADFKVEHFILHLGAAKRCSLSSQGYSGSSGGLQKLLYSTRSVRCILDGI